MRRSYVLLLLVLAALLVPSANWLFADTIFTKDGRSLKGEVIRRNGLVTIISPSGLFQFPEADVSDKPFPKEAKKVAEPLPIVQIETNHGTMKLELYEDETPNTVANFVHIVEQGMYDGTLFHRVIPGFVIQGGDPKTKQNNPSVWGTGGPGWRIKCELGPHRHERGVLSMAHAGKDTGGSQFFIVLDRANTAHLDGKHTVFGRVIEGLDVVDKIASIKRGPGDRPEVECKMVKVTVLQKRGHEYVPVKN